MDIKEFRAGNYIQQHKYKSFSPSKINKEWIWADSEINTLLSEANHKLGELNAFSLYVPSVDMYIRMHVAKEATSSSRIEGTETGMEDALKDVKDIEPEKRDDWSEVQNYIDAMNESLIALESIPLSSRLLKQAHAKLMSGVRGMHKLPGEYRISQNWIGGSTLKDAIYIPPFHSEVNDLMSDLEKFIHNDTIYVPNLIKIAIIHYQFETIHPFLDGNGRLGRMLIPLYLVSVKDLSKPTLYLSYYLEKNKTLYTDNLTLVRETNNLSQWIRFFLVAIIETSKEGISTFQEIIKLKESVEGNRIVNLGTKLPNAKKLINLLYKYPFISVSEVSDLLGVTATTANSLIKDFVKLGILYELTGRKRGRRFAFSEYLDLFK